VLTFAVVALFLRNDRFSGDHPGTVLLERPPARTVAGLRLLAAAIFLLTIGAGLFGVQDAYRNLITAMVWIIWWVGLAFVCALVGDLWALVNPLRTIYGWAEKLFAARTGGRRLSLGLAYPRALGAWPAVLLFFLFAWAELVWQDNDVPAFLARAVLGYALFTWGAMFLFGRDTWLEKGEAFTVAFDVLARFAPLHAEAGRLRLRPPGAGLLVREPVSVSYLAFVLLMLSTVTFDGFIATPLMQRIDIGIQRSPLLARWLFELSEWGLSETQVVYTAALAFFPLVFVAAYWASSWAMVRCARSPVPVRQAACAFVLTLVPIAVAYHLSHYFSLLLTAGQFIIPLASDPLGYGWNLFGTAGYKVDLTIVSPYVFWYGAVTLIVIGHVIAVVLAHMVALRMFPARAIQSQVPMLVLMVAYTTLSLWILAQPVVG
jgi:hypothetical protein